MKRSYITVNTDVDVDVDIADVLEDLDDDDLLEELKSRQLADPRLADDALEELRHLIHRRDWTGAMMLIEQIIAKPVDRSKQYEEWKKQNALAKVSA